MMWTLANLIRSSHECHTEVRPDVWVPARPLPPPWSWKLRSAWEVLRGRADAFVWPEGQ